MVGLHLAGHFFDCAVKIPSLADLIVGHSFGPYLVHDRSSQLVPESFTRIGNDDRPETAGASRVSQELLIVRGTEEGALSRVALCAASVCRTVVVLLFGNKLLNLLDLSLTGRSHFRELDYPKALKLLVSILTGHGIERV